MRLREWLAGDLLVSLRTLGRSPGYAAVVVLTLALGIAAATTTFSVVNGVLLRPLPFPHADRLVVVWETDRNSGTTREPASWPDFEDFAAQSRTLEGSAALVGSEMTLTPERGEPSRLSVVAATHDYFRVAGTAPLLGRTFTAEEDQPGGAKVALLGESFWRGRYGADPGVLGRTVRLDGVAYQVIGVVPDGAGFGIEQINRRSAYHPSFSGADGVGVWLPLQAGEAAFPRDTHPFFVLGRLAPGADVAAAQRELGGIAAELERRYRSNDARGVHVEALRSVVFGPVRPALLLLLAAVGLVLLVACVNVANLMLARGASRGREVAVQTALGATLPRLARRFLAESVLLSFAGAVAGVLLSLLLLRVLQSLAPTDVPRLAGVGLDGRVLAVALGVTVLVALAFGLLPTLQARGVSLEDALRSEGGRGVVGARHRRARQALVVAELALSVALVVTAGLLVRSFWSVLRVDPGFRAENVVKAQVELPAARYPQSDYSVWPKWKEIQAFDRTVLERLRALPGVRAAAIASAHPLDPGYTNSFTVVGREAEAKDWPEISVRSVTPGYFSTLGVRLVRGRALAESDDADAPAVAVVNQAAADRFFAGREPLGAEMQFWGVTWRIVGVVGNERIHGLTEPAPPAVYVPSAHAPLPSRVLLVRGSGDAATLAAGIRRAVRSVDPALAVYGIEPLDRTLSDSTSQRRFVMLVLGAYAALALLLALVGVYGVLSYTVAQRTPEMGVRMALGASRRDVLVLVLRSALALALLGIGAGLLLAWAGGRLVSGLLFGIPPLDPPTFLVVPAAVLAAALAAALLPARRATRVDPVDALRAQ